MDAVARVVELVPSVIWSSSISTHYYNPRTRKAQSRTGATELHLYVIQVILDNMKIGERGQVTIPKDLRERFGLKPETEVEFEVINNSILLRKKPRKLRLSRWKGRCRKSFKELGYTRVDEFIEDVRGR